MLLVSKKKIGCNHVFSEIHETKLQFGKEGHIYNHGQKCWEGNFILQIPPSPFSMLDFPGEKNGDFSYLKNSNIEYGVGGPQEHGISHILQPIVKKIALGVK